MLFVLSLRFLLVLSHTFFSSWEPGILLCVLLSDAYRWLLSRASYVFSFDIVMTEHEFPMKSKLTFYTSLVYSLRDTAKEMARGDCPDSCRNYACSVPDVLCRGFLDAFYSAVTNVLSIRAFPVPMGPRVQFSQGRYLSGLLDNSYLIFWCYFQIIFPCFILANICPLLLSIPYNYLQVGIKTPFDYFRGLCMLEQLPWWLWSPYSSFLHFCLLFIPLLHEFKIQNSLSASVLRTVHLLLSSKCLELNGAFWMGMPWC